MRSRKVLPLAAALSSALTLAGCATTGLQGTNAVPCESLAPITWSRKDTKETVRQVVGYNAVGKEDCHWKNANPTFSWSNVKNIGR